MAAPENENPDTNSILVSESPRRTGSFLSSNNTYTTKPQTKKWNIERSNLLNIAKICVKTLIDTSLTAGTGRVLTEESPQLEQFFIVFEHIVRHGLKDKRTFLGQRKDFLAVLEAVENKIASLPEILTNMRNLSDIKSNIGKTRAWMRLALMQKVLAEQMAVLVEERNILSEWYDSSSMLLSEEGSVISGLLVGLNVIDCNFDLKGVDLDSQNGIIDISLYLRDGNYLEKHEDDNKAIDQPDGQKIEVILDQKAYLEQLNKNLNDSVAALKQKAKLKEENDDHVENENGDLRNKLACVIAEREAFKRDYETLLEEHKKKFNVMTADLTTERETYQQSRTGLNDLYLNVQNELVEEKRQNKELKLLVEEQKAMNHEKQVAMKLLEKDIYDKQDTLIALRKQLEDIKKINLELHNKWQMSETSLKKHETEWSGMEKKCARMISQTKDMEKSLTAAESAKKLAEETAHQIGAKLAQVQAEKFALETDTKIEKEWRVGLQAELQTEKDSFDKVNQKLKSMLQSIKETDDLRRRLEESELRCNEQEGALFEMGQKLNRTHTEVDEMKELQAALKDKTWQDDKDATECQLCIQPFSLARRKHHCRSCGGIYCNSCSDNVMPLPSFAKPVRVCDTCNTNLLVRYSATAK